MQDTRLVVTRFLSAERAARLIVQQGLADAIAGMADYIRDDFLRWEDFEKTPRVANHSDGGVIELMPVSDHSLYAFKYVNGHPKNTRYNMSTVMAFGALADVDNGAPTFLAELTLTTALRTAAASAVAAKALARPNCRTMALIGNGAQSEFQAVAFARICGIEHFHLFDVDPAATDKLMRNLARLGLSATRFASTAEAVKGCDIVTTVTADKTNATILTPEMIEPGMHINGVGGDCPGKTELHRGVLEMGPVFVEYEPQTRIEGDIQQMPADFPVTELWRVLRGEVAGRTGDAQVTIFDSVGFALEDLSALRYMRDLAVRLGCEDEISLIPNLANPKNLFGFMPGYESPAADTVCDATVAAANAASGLARAA
jgi:ornithine cyclodeaminase